MHSLLWRYLPVFMAWIVKFTQVADVSAEYDQIFGQPEDEPKFGLATTVSQA